MYTSEKPCSELGNMLLMNKKGFGMLLKEANW